MLFETAAYRVVSLGCESEKIEDKEAVDIILTAAIWANQMRKSMEKMSAEQFKNMKTFSGLKPFPKPEAFCAWGLENDKPSSSEKPNNCGASEKTTDYLEFGGDFSEGWSNE
jgi:hypothetical protein